MKIKLYIMFLLLLIPLVSAEDIYVKVDLIASPNDSIVLDNIELHEGQASDNVLEYPDHYVIKVYSFKGDVLESFQAQRSFYVYDADIMLNESFISLSFPYHPNMAQLEIYYSNKKIFETSLADYATCNEDGICDLNENKADCPSDCEVKSFTEIQKPVEKNVTEGGVEVPEKGAEIEKAEPKSNWIYYLAGLVLFILIVLFFIFRKVDKQK